MAATELNINLFLDITKYATVINTFLTFLTNSTHANIIFSTSILNLVKEKLI
jgi:hypothetical protein